MLEYEGFFPSHVKAFTFGADADFSLPAEPGEGFTGGQKSLLESAIGTAEGFWFMKQVHGCDVIVAGKDIPPLAASKDDPAARLFTEGDALVTSDTHYALAVRTADCLPVFFYDKRSESIGLAHAGWKGTLQNICGKVLRLMRQQWLTDPADVICILGPAIRACCYKVGPEFKTRFPETILELNEELYFDLAAENKRQLLLAGVLPGNMRDCGQCTCCGKGFHSYRRDGAVSGRMLSLILTNK